MLLFCRFGTMRKINKARAMVRIRHQSGQVVFHSEVMLLAETLPLEFQGSLKKLSQEHKKMGRYSFKKSHKIEYSLKIFLKTDSLTAVGELLIFIWLLPKFVVVTALWDIENEYTTFTHDSVVYL